MINPATRNLLAAAALCALGVSAANAADIYYQPFDISAAPNTCDTSLFPGGAGTYPFPAGWLRFNVDARTPSGAVAYVNNAWIVREDFAFDVTECAAFSTSWYSPAGAADDWMWSPAIAIPAEGATLGWRAVAYDASYRDGYEVRVKTGAAPTQATQTTSDVVFSVAAEASAWTPHTTSLNTYAGQTVYIGFRNNSNDKFLLLVDDVRVSGVAPDLGASAPEPPFASEYARAPLGMDIVPSLAVTATNEGGVDLTNVSATAQPMLDGSPSGLAVPSSAPVPLLPVGGSSAMTFGAPAAFSGPGVWSIKYTLGSDQTGSDTNPANDVIELPGTTIGGNELARWEGAGSGTVGIGAGDGGELGVQLTIPADGWYAGAHFGMTAIPPDNGGSPPTANLCPGFDYVVNLRAFDTVNNVPGEVIATTEPVACAFDTAYSVDAPFAGGVQFLTAGTYVLTAVEAVGGPTLRLVLHNDRFLTGTTWANWPSIPGGTWSHFEAFGASFAKAPELSLLSGDAPELPIFVDGFDGASPPPPALRLANHPRAPLVQRPLRQPAATRLVDVHAH